MITEVTTIEQVHDQEQVLSILEGVVHVYYEGVVQLCEDLALVHDRLYASFRYNSSLGHFLHRILLFAFLPLDLPHFPKASFADAVHVIEVTLCQS